VNLLFIILWGCAGWSKVSSGKPAWFNDKFGGTFLAKFPGLDATFWLLTVGEVLGFLLALAALARGEFLRAQRPPPLLLWTLAWSLFLFVQLSLGQWLTNDFNSAAQLFAYFAGTLVSFHFASAVPGPASVPTARSE
jgi:hypothetical protein